MIGAGAVSAHDFTVLVTPIDVAIDSVDFNESLERESNDRPLELPQFQDSLVNCVLDANPNTIVLFNAGSNVDMSHWQQRAPALLYLWYPGQEGGQAAPRSCSERCPPAVNCR